MKNITTREQFTNALQALVNDSDMIAMGAVKQHQIDNPNGDGTKIDGDESFFSASFRLPKGSAVTLGDSDFYPNTLQIKLDAFKLAVTPNAPASASSPIAATANADRLRALLAKKPVAGDIVAVPASKVTPTE